MEVAKFSSTHQSKHIHPDTISNKVSFTADPPPLLMSRHPRRPSLPAMQGASLVRKHCQAITPTPKHTLHFHGKINDGLNQSALINELCLFIVFIALAFGTEMLRASGVREESSGRREGSKKYKGVPWTKEAGGCRGRER